MYLVVQGMQRVYMVVQCLQGVPNVPGYGHWAGFLVDQGIQRLHGGPRYDKFNLSPKAWTGYLVAMGFL